MRLVHLISVHNRITNSGIKINGDFGFLLVWKTRGLYDSANHMKWHGDTDLMLAGLIYLQHHCEKRITFVGTRDQPSSLWKKRKWNFSILKIVIKKLWKEPPHFLVQLKSSSYASTVNWVASHIRTNKKKYYFYITWNSIRLKNILSFSHPLVVPNLYEFPSHLEHKRRYFQ